MSLHPTFAGIVDDFRIPRSADDDALAGAYLCGLNRGLAAVRAFAHAHPEDTHAALVCSAIAKDIENLKGRAR